MNYRWLGYFGMKVLVVLYLITSTAAAAGYHAATNESVEATELRQNLTVAMDDAQEQIERNTTGIDGELRQRQAMPILKVFDMVLGPSFDYGYKYPESAWWYLNFSPFVVLGGLLSYGYGKYVELQRKGVI